MTTDSAILAGAADLEGDLRAAQAHGAPLNATWQNDVEVRMRLRGDLGIGEHASGAQLAQFLVGEEVEKQLLRRRAREVVEQIEAAHDPAPPFDAGTLGEVLARDPEPPHRAEGLIPWEAGTLVVAQRKTGKTTFMLNLARSFINGRPLLGRYPVRPIEGTVALLNFEVSAATAARWADEHGVDRDRLVLVNLRGRRNPLDHPVDRERLAALLRAHDAETLLVDPFGRAYTGRSQNDSGEVGAWLRQLDQFARAEAGALDLVLTAHAGWEGERTRGASALEDWADSIITLVRGKDDDNDQRFLRAIGRDVDVEEDRLAFDPDTRTLSMTGAGSRQKVNADAKVDALVDAVVAVVQRSPGATGSDLAGLLRDAGHSHQRGAERKAAHRAVERGLLRIEPGSNNRKHYYAVETPPAIPAIPSHPVGTASCYPEPVLKDGIARWEGSASSCPETRGPCTKCGQLFAGRYGDGGRPWCEACRAGADT